MRQTFRATSSGTAHSCAGAATSSTSQADADALENVIDLIRKHRPGDATQAEAKKTQQDLEYTSGEEAQKILKEVLSQPKDIIAEFSKYIKFGE